MFQLETRNRCAALLVAAMIFGQLLALGAVGGSPSAFFALCEIALCLGLIFMLDQPSSEGLWRAVAPVMLLFLCALTWAAAPDWLTGLVTGRPFRALAPDARPVELLKLAGLGAIWLSGGLIGLSRARLQQFVLCLAVLGLAYTLLALRIGQASPLAVWGQPKGAHAFRFTGTFLNANAAGCVFGMLGVVALGLLQSLMKRVDLRQAPLMEQVRLGLAACAVVAAFGACVLTQSRTALTLAGLFGAIMVVIEAWRGLRRERASKARLAVLGLTAVLLTASLGLGASQISSRWGTFVADANLRAESYAHYFAAIAASPWFGYGLGGFRMAHASLLNPALAGATWDFGAAHSAVTQAALEGGLPFLALLLAAVGVALAQALMVRRSRGAMVSGLIAAAALAFCFSFVDIALNTPAIAALCCLLIGVAWGDAVGWRAGARGATGAAQAGTGSSDV